MELRVESGMAGMCPIMPRGGACPGYDLVPGMNYIAVINRELGMPHAAVRVTLTAAERSTLNKRVRDAKTPYRDRLRAQVVFAAAAGQGNARIAADLGVTADTVRKWRGRVAQRAGGGVREPPPPPGPPGGTPPGLSAAPAGAPPPPPRT